MLEFFERILGAKMSPRSEISHQAKEWSQNYHF